MKYWHNETVKYGYYNDLVKHLMTSMDEFCLMDIRETENNVIIQYMTKEVALANVSMFLRIMQFIRAACVSDFQIIVHLSSVMID